MTRREPCEVVSIEAWRRPAHRSAAARRWKIVAAILLAAAAAIIPLRAQEQVLVQSGSAMRYRANTTNPNLLNWSAFSFNDSAWPAGTYGVGYDTAGPNGLLATQVSSSSASVYTRATFNVADPLLITNLFLGADYDDGFVAWLNGVEVYRSSQMPAGVPAWNTVAGSHESSNNAPPNYQPLINVSSAGLPALRTGTNVLAVGVWNATLPSSDLVLVPYLVANRSASLTRGPYLQRPTSASIVVRWRTSIPTDSVVMYGPPGGPSQAATDATLTTEHVVTIAGLQPATSYTYSVGTSATALAGGDAAFTFRTAPAPGARVPIRVWAVGDSGTANANAAAVRNAWLGFSAARRADVWLMLGDNAYPNGTDAEYQAAVFDMYPSVLRNTPLWPTMGNHDGISSASEPAPAGPYYNMFTLPAGGESGGSVSGTESYYSFDHGNVHFICLNSENEDRSIDGAMIGWLEQDLANTMADWIIAFWHHPPYSKGSHDSDSLTDSGGRMIEMRQRVLPILEDWGVDLVLAGHSHNYERSFLIDGHYGFSSTFNQGMKKDGGNGRPSGDGAYEKPSIGLGAHEGAVYVVSGTSGETSSGALNHPAMFLSLNVLGSLVLDIVGDRLDATFLDSLGTARDTFTLIKQAGAAPVADFGAVPRAGVAPLAVIFNDLSSTNTSSWAWDFTADGVTDSAAPSPSTVFTQPGAYAVRLTAANQGGSDVETKTGFVCVAAQGPGPVGGLTLAATGGGVTWNPATAATGYDVVKGNLATLISTRGDFGAAVLGCLVDNGASPSATDAGLPPVGDGYFYLARSVGACGLNGTYDEGGTQQLAPRDPRIAASPAVCP